MVDEDIKTLLREFRASVSADLEAQHQRMDDFADELRQRVSTTETAMLNEIRDLSKRIDRRIDRVEQTLAEIVSLLRRE